MSQSTLEDGSSANSPPAVPALTHRPITTTQGIPRAAPTRMHRAKGKSIPGALPKSNPLLNRPVTVVSKPIPSTPTPETTHPTSPQPSRAHLPRAPPPKAAPVTAIASTPTTTPTAVHPPVDGMREWWLSRSLSLPEERRNGWVL